VQYPLVGPLAAIAGGILVSRYVPFHQSELLALIGAFLLLGLLALTRKARLLAGICCLPGLFCAGALTAVAHAPAPAPELDVEGREVVVLGGCVVEPPAISGERERFILELEPGARAQVTLYVKNGAALPPLRYGQNVDLEARVRKVRNYGNPGAFDYARFLSRQDIYWTASSASDTVKILDGQCGARLQNLAMDLRAAVLNRTSALFHAEPYQTGMMQALLIGQNYQLQRVWTEEYRNTGTFHVLVISGTHLAILAAFFLFVLRICFVPESIAMLLTVMAAWLYALMTGWGAPCVRSAAGLTLFMICSYFYRERRSLNLLAAVALGFLILDPEQLFDASFQLTFLAVAFLAVFAAPLIAATSGPLARGLAELADTGRDLHLEPRVAQFRIEMRLLAKTLRMALRLPERAGRIIVTSVARVVFFVYELTAVSAVIQIGLALPMVVYFHRLGISGLSANAFAVPIMGVLVPAGFVAVATGWEWMGKICVWLLALSRGIVGWHASIEPHWRVPVPPVWLGVAFSLALLAFAIARGRWWRLAAGALVAAALALLVWHPFPAEAHRGELEMSVIDVGQGDSILLVSPEGKRMIIDGGGIPSFGGQPRAQMDIGEDVVAPYLWERGFRTVDVVAISHAHEDHIGGVKALMADFRPRELWIGAMPDSPAWHAVEEEAHRVGTRIVPMQEHTHVDFGGAAVDVLAPLTDYIPSDTPKNDDSLVFRVRYGERTFLLMGDVEKRIERWILADNELCRADVLKVAHHGSRTSSTQEFLDAVRPAFAVVSVGLDNSYGHPNHEVLDRLADMHTAIYRTDQQGLVTVITDGKRVRVETAK
jgi:competence protein ComEC